VLVEPIKIVPIFTEHDAPEILSVLEMGEDISPCYYGAQINNPFVSVVPNDFKDAMDDGFRHLYT